jgi:hypothetical protein
MNDPLPATEPSLFLPSPEATVKIHNPLLFAEDVLWGAHALFAVLALLGVVLIMFGRGPRRADAYVDTQGETAPLNAVVSEQTHA